jgi:hypothetical protein
VADYLQYWQPDYELGSDPPMLNHAAAPGFKKVDTDDVVWAVTTKAKRLVLIGRIVVGSVVGQEEAEKRLPYSPWPGEFHVLAKDGSIAKHQVEIDIERIGRRLRFISPKSDRLPPERAKWGMSLRSVRMLSPESARLLRKQLKEGARRTKAKGERELAAAVEGMLRESLHYQRGRSRELRDRALAGAEGKCEACQRDYSKLLDGQGRKVLQVHHKKQLALFDGPQLTKMSDLAVVCANCHALIHINPKKALPVRRLRQLLEVPQPG